MTSSGKWTALALVSLLGVGAARARADQITLYNTGVASDGTLLKPGAADPHYQLTTNDGTPSTATVGVNGASDTAFPVWIANTSTSQWIIPQTNSGIGEGNYTYTTSFDLKGMDPSTVKIIGQLAADDSATIALNGKPTGLGTIPAGVSGFYQFTTFALSSGLVPGVNTLSFTVNDYNGIPSGLQVRLGLGPLTHVPEPSVLALGGLTALGLLVRTYRRRPRAA